MRRLFTAIVAVMATVGALAQSVGDYIYTRSGKVKITNATNLVANGDFSQGLDGWTTENGRALSPDTFAVMQDGPNGANAIVTLMKDNGPATGSDFYQRVTVQGGQTYYISYCTRTEGASSSTTTYGEKKNYQNIYFNTMGSLTYEDGTLNADIAIATPAQSLQGEWTQIAYTFTAPVYGYIFIHCYAPYVGQEFADFKVLEAQGVPDDREVNKTLATIDGYLANPLFPNGHEILENTRKELATALENDDKTAADEIMTYFPDEILASFLDENTVNVSDKLDMRDFDDATVSTNNVSSVGKWKITFDDKKSRWQVAAASQDPASPLTTTHLYRSIPGYTELSASTVAQTINLPAGKYMYTMKLNACRYIDKTNTIKVDSTGIRGLYVFMGKDTVECLDVDTFKMNRYTVYTELTEPTDVSLGFHMTTPTCHEICLDLTELRAIGTTQEDFDAYYNAKLLATARESLAAKIATARELYASTDYIFGKPALSDSINISQTLYDTQTEVSEETIDLTNNQTKRLGRAISAYQTLNAEYVSLGEAVKEGETIVADATITSDKKTLADAIANGKSYYESLTVGSERDSTTLASHADAIRDAITAVKSAQLSADEMYRFYEWATPADAIFATTLATDELEISAGDNWTTLRLETAPFGGHDLAGRFAFNNDGKRTLDPEAGLQITSAKNKIILSLQNLKAGNEVIVDWSLSAGTLYVASGNATCTLDDGTTREYTITGKAKALKVDSNSVTAKNTDGLNGTHRSRFVMTADGTLDFFVSSSTTLTLPYVAFNKKSTPTGINEAADNSTDNATVRKIVRDGKLYIQTPRGLYNAAGVRVE